jgi:tRNA/rRNA methyltransferase/tRNA (cytidine32/uridine32-2'-O)-methyltransferase
VTTKGKTIRNGDNWDDRPEALRRTVVVLWEPQDDINIGNAVRACKNFGVTDLRLVRPAKANLERVSISAPKAADVIQGMEIYDDLDSALADCTKVFGTTARERGKKWSVAEPRAAAGKSVEAATGEGRSAFLFGREDSGLPNEALDRCHYVVTIPTNPAHTSINLGQAVLLCMWEVFRAATDAPVARSEVDALEMDLNHPAASQEEIDSLVDRAEETLEEIGFFRHESNAHIVRTLRKMFLRANLDTRETAIWHGIFSKMSRYVTERLEEAGLTPDEATEDGA